MDDTLLLTARGEIDRACEPDLNRLLDSLPITLSDLVLDMQDVRFMDVTGLHFLCDLHQRTARRHTRLHTRGWQAQPRYLLHAAVHLNMQGQDLNTVVRAALERSQGPS
ncbi:STAS domain-containing protein [Streptomyces sp. NPDC017993]|uniref:STAS domain-containing protein n=1 Tax=Streptomyces sp. NPDC017993 TaxID=3365027 RepID=UPI0037A87DC0